MSRYDGKIVRAVGRRIAETRDLDRVRTTLIVQGWILLQPQAEELLAGVLDADVTSRSENDGE